MMGESPSSRRAYTTAAVSVGDVMGTCGSSESAVFVSGNLPPKGKYPALKSLPGNLMTQLTDPIGDLLTRMRNAQRVRKMECNAPWSKAKQQLCELLKKEEWIKDIEVKGEGIGREVVVTFLEEKPTLELKRISKPGRRVYQGYSGLRPVLNGFGIAILTTSEGFMTDKEARKKHIGGEVLCTIA